MKAIQKTAAASEALAVLTLALEQGEFAPGARLTEEALARDLGVSRVPVREALSALVARRLLVRRDSGTFVPNLEYGDLEEIYLARGTELESLLLRRAANDISNQTIATLRTLTSTLEREGKSRSVKRLGEHNREFHFSIMRHANLPVVLGIVGDLWDRTEYYRSFYSLDPEHRATIVDEHKLIIDACVDRDAVSLVRLHNDHRQWLLSGDFPWLKRDDRDQPPKARQEK